MVQAKGREVNLAVSIVLGGGVMGSAVLSLFSYV